MSPPGIESVDKNKEDKEKAILAIQRNQEMLQTKADLVKVTTLSKLELPV